MKSTIFLDQTDTTQAKFRGRILQTFLLVFIPISFLPMIILGTIGFTRARNLLVDQSYSQIDNYLQIIEKDIENLLNNSQIRLDAALRNDAFKEAALKILSTNTPGHPKFDNDRRYILDHLNSLNQERGNVSFKHFLVLSTSGEIIISTQPEWEGNYLSDTRFTSIYNDSYGSLFFYDLAPMISDEMVILSFVPIEDQDSSVGYIIGFLNPNRLHDILTSVAQFQTDSQSYLILDNNVFIGPNYYVEELNLLSPTQSQLSLFQETKEKYIQQNNTQNINTSLFNFSGQRAFASYKFLDSIGAGLVVDIPAAIALENLQSLTPFTIISLLVLLVLIGIIIGYAARRFSRPLLMLSETTNQFAQGNWESRAPENRDDEIGLLAFTFNQMAEELSTLYQSLSSQVTEQTQELQTRSSQFEATAQVAREAAAIHDLDSLLSQTTALISQHFGYYHAGIFLIDEMEKFAVLQAANSEGGLRMLTRGHKLAVGQTGVVGRVAETGSPLIALDVGDDRYFFDNPDLPETRSEMALPLKIQKKIIGVLDVQSKTAGAFTNADAEVLQIMADQVALAINNAHLLEQTEQTVHELNTLYGEQLEKGWTQSLSGQTKTYHFDRVRVKPVESESMLPFYRKAQNRVRKYTDEAGNHILNIPINLRENPIGAIVLRRNPEEIPWTEDDLELAKEVTTQIAISLENARLLEESQRRATQERLLSQASTRFSQSLNINTVLQMAVRELGQLSGVKEVTVELAPDQ